MAEELTLGFASGSKVRDLHIIGVDIREWMSRPFEVDVLLVRMSAPLSPTDVTDLIGQPATVAIGSGLRDRFHGTISSVEYLDPAGGKLHRYQVRIVPELALLTLGKRSAIYQDMTIPDLVEAVLKPYGLTKGSDFEIRVTGASTNPKREYIVQYQESDWDFLMRWLEHEGFYTFFEHHESEAIFVVADDNQDAALIEKPKEIQYRPRNQLSSGNTATMWDVRVKEKKTPRAVSVVDYNYRRPEKPVGAAASVFDKGFGHVALYGDHVKDEKEAAAIATLRAQELASDRVVLSGTTDCARVRTGHRFMMENHPAPEYDGEYLVLSARHRAGVPVDGTDEQPKRYWGEFESIPAATPFRAPRRTEWPSIHGVLHGHVMSDGSGQTAEVDELGRYKVRMPFDLGSNRGLAASRWVRKAQPYSGAGYGQHFPIHKGTEVLLAFMDGDPDRPMIVGTVPHATTPSPVNRANASQSVVETATGIRLELEDMA